MIKVKIISDGGVESEIWFDILTFKVVKVTTVNTIFKDCSDAIKKSIHSEHILKDGEELIPGQEIVSIDYGFSVDILKGGSM